MIAWIQTAGPFCSAVAVIPRGPATWQSMTPRMARGWRQQRMRMLTDLVCFARISIDKMFQIEMR